MGRLVYLDNAATTRLSKRVFLAMEPFLFDDFANPASVSSFALKSRVAVEQSRAQVARVLNARKEQICFTSGGTESNNMALRGVVKSFKSQPCHIITTKIEHHSILNTCADLENDSVRVTYLDVDQDGLIDLDRLEDAIDKDTALISIQHGNNEVGTIQPICAIGKIAQKHNVLFHVDAIQTFGHLPIDVVEANIDFLSLSAHKVHGPKGVGALFVKNPNSLRPLLTGGAQERKLRAGTQNTPGIVGLGAAGALAAQDMAEVAIRIKELRDYFIAKIRHRFPEVRLNGSREYRLDNNINLYFPNIANETLLALLDSRGICASSGAACSSGSLEPSHVLMSMAGDKNRARQSIRFTLSKYTTREDLDYVLASLSEIIPRFQSSQT